MIPERDLLSGSELTLASILQVSLTLFEAHVVTKLFISFGGHSEQLLNYDRLLY